MKAADFRYVRPGSLDAALRLLDEHPGAVPLAGGQSLLAGLNMRVSTPELLVDIGDLKELKGIRVDATSVRIGALCTHSEVLRSPVVRQHLPLLPQALRLVAHAAVRNRGTFGGSLAYADPAAELPACSVALDGVVQIAGSGGRRQLAATAFFTGFMQTALRPGELIAEIIFPIGKHRTVAAIDELARRHGDFALAGVAAVGQLVGDALADPRFVYFGCVSGTRLAAALSSFLHGRDLPIVDDRALERAIQADIDPSDSPGCSATTRRQLAAVLTRRVLRKLGQQRDA